MTLRQAAPLIQINGIVKSYQGLLANDNVDLTLIPGEIHALIGENGAGKSTLVKIINGVIPPDAGQILWCGKPVEINHPSIARDLGISMVFQQFALFETLSVVENVALGLAGRTNLVELAEQIADVSNYYGLPVDPYRRLLSMSAGERQRIEIIRCLLQKPILLIMDEPTSVLSPSASEKLFAALEKLSGEGCSILYISHKLEEVRRFCHTATVLRSGKVVGRCRPGEESSASLARMMVGKGLPVCEHGSAMEGGPVLLRLEGVSLASPKTHAVDLRDIHLEVRAGEIVGVAGVVGNGQAELMSVISGEQLLTDKRCVQMCGRQVGKCSPRERRKLGFGYVPEQRLGRAAVAQMTLSENAMLTMLRPPPSGRFLIKFPTVHRFTRDCIEQFDVRCAGVNTKADTLSGGNLQKYIVGREVLQAPKILLLAYPTQGLDMGAASFIRQQLHELREQGAAVLIFSEEIEELMEVADRIAVLAKGRLSPAKRVQESNLVEIGLWMSGEWTASQSRHTVSGSPYVCPA